MPLPKSITRRHAIATIGGGSLATLLAACGSDSKSTGTTTTSGQNDTTSTGAEAGSTTTVSILHQQRYRFADAITPTESVVF